MDTSLTLPSDLLITDTRRGRRRQLRRPAQLQLRNQSVPLLPSSSQPTDQLTRRRCSLCSSASKVLAERRLEVLRDMASSSYGAKTQQDWFDAIMTSLSTSPHDIPFAILYNTELSPLAPQPVVTTHAKPETHAKVSLSLCGSIGVPAGHTSAPAQLTLTVDLNQRSGSIADGFLDAAAPTPIGRSKSPSVEPMMLEPRSTSFGDNAGSSISGESGSGVTVTSLDGKKACPWPIAEAIATRRTVFVEDCRSLVEGFESRSWGEEPTETALVIPIADTDDPTSTKQAVLIVGLNTRRPYDRDYEVRALSTSDRCALLLLESDH